MKSSLWAEMLSTDKYLSHTVWLLQRRWERRVSWEITSAIILWSVFPLWCWSCENLVCVCLGLSPGQESWEVWVSSLAEGTSWWNSGENFQAPQVVVAKPCLERSLVAVPEVLVSDFLILDLNVFTSVLVIRFWSPYDAKIKDKYEIRERKKKRKRKKTFVREQHTRQYNNWGILLSGIVFLKKKIVVSGKWGLPQNLHSLHTCFTLSPDLLIRFSCVSLSLLPPLWIQAGKRLSYFLQHQPRDSQLLEHSLLRAGKRH